MGIKNVHVPHSTVPPPPLLEKYILFFALPSTNGPLPAELKFRENTEHYVVFQQPGPGNN